jgi:hypothetical protein
MKIILAIQGIASINADVSDQLEAVEAQSGEQTATGQESPVTVGSPSPEGDITTQTTESGSPPVGPRGLGDITNAEDYEKLLMDRNMILSLPETKDQPEPSETVGDGGDGQQPPVEETPPATEQPPVTQPEGGDDDGSGKRPQFRLRPTRKHCA